MDQGVNRGLDRKLVITIIVIMVGVAFGIGLWYWQKKSSAPPSPAVQTKTSEEKIYEKDKEGGLGAQIFEKTQNPLKEKLPDTNPFSADTNPFDANTNPFKDTYKNPFR